MFIDHTKIYKNYLIILHNVYNIADFLHMCLHCTKLYRSSHIENVTWLLPSTVRNMNKMLLKVARRCFAVMYEGDNTTCGKVLAWICKSYANRFRPSLIPKHAGSTCAHKYPYMARCFLHNNHNLNSI